jgi:adenylate kinase
MSTIQLADKQFDKFIKAEHIQHAVNGVAVRLVDDFKDKNPVFLIVLNGAFFFAADLIKKFDYPCEMSFIKVASYQGTDNSGEITTVMGAEPSLKNRSVVVVEDIVDSGNTIETIIKILKGEGVKEYAIASLFYKPDAFTKSFRVDYVGLEIEDDFIVGYGLDYFGLGRNLKDIYKLKEQQMTNIVLFGPPGAGKGTQAEFLKEKYNLVHISTGDVFRYNIKNSTDLGTLAKSYMDKGQLVPDSVTIKMLNAEVEKNPEANGFIFDGFPRTQAQAAALQELMTSKNSQINAMLALEVADEVLIDRLLERGKSSGRADDANKEVISNRIAVYYKETDIVKEFYQAQDKYYGVDGIGTIQEITQRLNAVMDSL